MARRPPTFRQQDVTRALRAARAAGVKVSRVEIDNGGKITLVAGDAEPVKPTDESTGGDEWGNI